MKTNPSEAQALLTATERLIGNEQMGRLFKVLAFAPPALGGMAGFGP
jgi:SAM-dependent MidA family methyltransferase